MAQYPNINAGDDFTVEMLRSMITNYIFKSTSTTRASTTTLADDPDLLVPVEANAVTWIRFVVRAAAILAEDIKIAWSVPSGATGNRHVIGPGSTATDASADNIAVRLGVHVYSTALTYSGVRNSASNQFVILEEAMITTSSTAGNVALQWAQATSGATGAVVASGSWAEYRRVA